MPRATKDAQPRNHSLDEVDFYQAFIKGRIRETIRSSDSETKYKKLKKNILKRIKELSGNAQIKETDDTKRKKLNLFH